MSAWHQARTLRDDELLAALASIVRRSNELTAELIEHLVELDQRQLHLDLGFPSLFAYCVESLGLCEATAGRRIAVARVCRTYPEALARIASGALHVSALCLLKQYLTAENATELFELCSAKSARKIERLLAERFPKPYLSDSMRRLPTSAKPTLNVESAASETRAHVSSTAAPHIREEGCAASTAPSLARSLPAASNCAGTFAPAKAQRPEPLSADRFAIRFTADTEFCQLLDRVRGLAGHRLPSGDLLTLLKRGLLACERELVKERFSVGRKPRTPRLAATTESPSNPRRRLATQKRPAAAIVREVYARDKGQCTFISKDGRRCATCNFLELDHVIPWAVGGADTLANLRLRCRAHNQRYAQRCFGSAHVRAAVARVQSREASGER